jgi:hypothetical protein
MLLPCMPLRLAALLKSHSRPCCFVQARMLLVGSMRLMRRLPVAMFPWCALLIRTAQGAE